ncbi:lipid-A-disaccharide synthase [uncultured Tenacibaculum sp.]|uniref:lipid-A-disaccharide synthase n=1 Tax=uncultured Tenacibaculum sp. TaxID=174713 RepID=UPI002638867F|nr:lipid-A-disaccharide synthase [uncultured Tenacibaculum sp.]
MKYYIVAGEASGDLHGSNLMKEIFKQDKSAQIRFWGGDLMQQVGGELVVHYNERSFMGFIEPLLNIRKILGFFKKCKQDITSFQPDVVIFIDNSGFNLPIAKWAKEEGFRTNYYISPQVWASRASRVKAIKRDVDQMFVILPFEKDFYKKYNYEVEFVGHPLIDGIVGREQVDEQEFRNEHNLGTKEIIALLPGSRKQEITKMLTTMLKMVDKFPDYQFVVAGAPSKTEAFYQSFLQGKNVKFISNKTYDLLSISHAALVTSGTATLETALFKVPQVVCYKGSWLSYQIAKRIITLEYISLVNLIMDRPVVKELIQNEFNESNLEQELQLLLNGEKRKEFFLDYFDLEEKLGGKGASKKAAHSIIKGLT